SFKQEVELINLKHERTSNQLQFDKVVFDKSHYFPFDDIVFEVKLKRQIDMLFRNIILSFHIVDKDHNTIYHISSIFLEKTINQHKDNSRYKFIIKKNALKPGQYFLNMWLSANNEEMDWIPFQVVVNIQEGNIYNSSYPILSGFVQPDFDFNVYEDIAN
ncbi:TPA: hypothetical protein ENS27_00385, partial [bacterium]|nr:hypothetical protein [bacterium]